MPIGLGMDEIEDAIGIAIKYLLFCAVLAALACLLGLDRTI